MAIAVRDLRSGRPEQPVEASLDFDAFYRAYSRRVRGLVRRQISDPALAAEIVQDTFVRAHRHFDSLDRSRSAWPWLAAVASNLCIDALRRSSREDSYEEVDADAAGWCSDPAEAFELSLQADAVRAALALMPARQRQVLMLKDDEGWTAEQIARLDGVSAEGIKSLVRRARATFRESYHRLADERGLLGGFAALGAPLARLRARVQRAVGARIPTLPLPAFALPLDAGSLVGAAALSVLLTTGTAAASLLTVESIRHDAPVVTTAADADGATAADAAGAAPLAMVGISVAPTGAPVAADAAASLHGEEEKRTLEVIIAAKTGIGGSDGKTWTNFECDHSELRSAACDTAEQLPSLAPEE